MAAASVVAFIATLLIAPALVARIPADYFTHKVRPPARSENQHPVIRIALRIGKNVLGWVFILAGIAMLALPGQGLLTIFAGVLLVDCPGKYRFEKWLVAKKPVRRPINWLRKRSGRPPLQLAKPS